MWKAGAFLKMKNLIVIIILIIIIIVLFIATSCTKERECGRVQQVTKLYNANKVWLKDSVTWDSETAICGEQFMNFQIMEERDTVMTAICVNGETIGFKKVTIITQ